MEDKWTDVPQMLGRKECTEMIFKKHSCEKCGKKFGKIEDLMHHQLIAHERSLYSCEKCGADFEGMEQMRDHVKKFHSYNKQVEERKRRSNRIITKSIRE